LPSAPGRNTDRVLFEPALTMSRSDTTTKIPIPSRPRDDADPGRDADPAIDEPPDEEPAQDREGQPEPVVE
jgi:hypothetical protein